MAKKKRIDFQDEIVVYHSKVDGCWIAHSLRTDQVGPGESVVDALTELMRALRATLAAAEADETLAYLREAPPEVQAIARGSTPMPEELFEIAHKKVHGTWPEELSFDATPRNERMSFRGKVPPGLALC